MTGRIGNITGHIWIHSSGKCQACGAELGTSEGRALCPALEVIDAAEVPFVTQFLRKSADIYAERNAVYKDNYKMVGKLMVALFPNGITLKTVEEHNKFHLFMLAIVKLSRYATNYEAGHEPSVEDLIVYMAMVQALDAEAAAALKAAENATVL